MMFIHKNPDKLGGVVVRDDFESFTPKNDTSDDATLDQEKFLNDYGIVTTDKFDYISTVKTPDRIMPGQGIKQDVDKIETIAFPGKISIKEEVVLYTEEEYKDMTDKES